MAALAPPGDRYHAKRATLLTAFHDGHVGPKPFHAIGPGGDLDERRLAGLQDGAALAPSPIHQFPDPGDSR
jgi:hypothetical protein